MATLNKWERRLKENTLERLLERYPDKKWDSFRLSANPNLPPHYLLANSGRRWHWFAVSANPAITTEFIDAHPELPWDWDGVSINPNLTFEFIERSPVHWDYLSSHKLITWEYVLSNPKEWDYRHMSRNPNITIKITKDHPHLRWDKIGLSENPSLTWEDIKENVDKLDLYGISKHPSLTWDNISSMPLRTWCWAYISQHPAVTPEIVKANPRLVWNDLCFAKNPNFGLSDLPRTPHHWSDNPNVCADDIEGHEWDWERLSGNPFNKEPIVRKRLEALAKKEDALIEGIRAELGPYVAAVLSEVILEYVFTGN